jgi:D-alanyl-D-alanine carboxypeptidase
MRSVTSSNISIFLRLLACVCALSLAVPSPADAGRKAPPRKEASHKGTKKKSSYSPPYAELVIDAKTGKILAADNPDAPRHPASLTKVMTLYLLFDELERGTLNLKTPLKVSAEAARQPPSKLGLKPGDTIEVEDAIKALVTKSANDVAVAVAENISGSEAAFADRMMRKARSLGMTSTVYVNASGLPDDRQVTTARDLVLLGRAIQDNHPKYYDYFSTHSFSWKGHAYRNHNRLLGSVRGVDGIKTGYIRASGFNLLTSAKDKGRAIVAVVLGGRSSKTRDAHMRELVAENIGKASAGPRTAPLIAERPMPPEPVPAIATSRASTAIAAAPMPVPRPQPTQTAMQKDAAIDLPTPVMAAVAASAPQPIADETDAPQPARNPTMTPDAIAQRIAVANKLAMATTTPAEELRWVTGAQPASGVSAYTGTTPGSGQRLQPQTALEAVQPHQKPIQIPQPVVAAAYPAQPEPQTAAVEPVSAPEPAPQATPRMEAAIAEAQPARPGWLIQIAATPDQSQARSLLERVSEAVQSADRDAEPFTEPVEKDGVTLYRARFAGFSERSAVAACKAVKKSSLSCFTLKN